MNVGTSVAVRVLIAKAEKIQRSQGGIRGFLATLDRQRPTLAGTFYVHFTAEGLPPLVV